MSITIGNDAVVCAEASVTGTVTIGAKTVVHPKATIESDPGPIIIGDSCVIEELVCIRNQGHDPIVIGDHNVFEVGCQVSAAAIGNANVFQPLCIVQRGAAVGNGCTLGVKVVVKENSRIEHGTCIVGNEERFERHERLENAVKTHSTESEKHVAILRKTLPHFHHMQQSR